MSDKEIGTGVSLDLKGAAPDFNIKTTNTSVKFVLEDRYLVVKRKDILAGLDEWERNALFEHAELVDKHRESTGKAPLKCAVVESDWPEYDIVVSMIANRVNATNVMGDDKLSPLKGTPYYGVVVVSPDQPDAVLMCYGLNDGFVSVIDGDPIPLTTNLQEAINHCAEMRELHPDPRYDVVKLEFI